jgi:hypothetical protein
MSGPPGTTVSDERRVAPPAGVTRIGVGGRHEPLNRSFLIPSDLIFDSNVEPGMPSFAAAPDGPETRPLIAARAASATALLRAARDEALAWLSEDPDLSRPESAALRAVLTHRWKGRLGLARVG